MLALGALGGGVIASMSRDPAPTASDATQVEAARVLPTDSPVKWVAGEQRWRRTPTGVTIEVSDNSADPLGFGRPMVNQDCTNRWLAMVASTGTPAEYISTLLPRMSITGAQYLRTDQSCSSFNQGLGGSPIFAVYLGPFDTMEEACQARSDTSVGDAYVRQLDAAVPSRHLCSCLFPGYELPTLDSSNASEPSIETQYLVTDIQVMLVRAGFNPGNAIGGHYLELTTSMVAQFQASVGLPATGTTYTSTWNELQAFCEPGIYD